MKPFPDEHDLIALFECEPIMTDEDVPWAYNRLTFKIDRGVDSIICAIEAGNETVEFEWSKSGKRIVSLMLNWVSGMEVESNKGSEVLVIYFRDKHLSDLRIQFKPEIEVSWGTGAEPL